MAFESNKTTGNTSYFKTRNGGPGGPVLHIIVVDVSRVCLHPTDCEAGILLNQLVMEGKCTVDSSMVFMRDDGIPVYVSPMKLALLFQEADDALHFKLVAG